MILVKTINKHIIAFILLSVLVILLISSCSTAKTYQELEDERQAKVLKNNCAGYTLNYTDKVSEERDSVTIYGKVRYCSTKEIPPKTKISFYGTNDSLKYQTETNEKGYYEIKVTNGPYSRIQADCYGASLVIPSVNLGTVGDAGGAMNIDMKLLRHFMHVFVHSMELTRKDIRQIKKNRNRSKH
ncbi:carboxypeptidase-like regulatory domain-containing protein [Arcticibacter tournemirensis]|uniref:Carboxypeptidase regulatory-like domain-containing protein n=1 Tax=Arcticibacter tournemirensis TaxID=699437 RepID=A0A4Q0M5B5_9SPHI|nr:carboxypeptidase-like regulatory domain-containing protein [Arcticibacter tournemirensis]RXF68124.1 carboxypeptidase regulatory-like domain-containing protein [Arcticibacter tournemirensis]